MLLIKYINNEYIPGNRELKYLLGLLILLNIVDGLTTHFLTQAGIGREGNPFLFRMVGEPEFMIIKVVGVVVCVLILWDIYRRYPRLAFMSTLCFVIGYTAIVFWNLSFFLS